MCLRKTYGRETRDYGTWQMSLTLTLVPEDAYRLDVPSCHIHMRIVT